MSPRIVKEHEERKKELLDTAGKLFLTKGYESTSIADIIEVVGVAKGTFYHYFKSKEELLDELAADRIKENLKRMQPLIDDDSLPALEKLLQFFNLSAEIKLENIRETKILMTALLKEENILLRYKISEVRIRLVAPLLTQIVRQGIAEGVFASPFPDDISRIILRIAGAFQDETRGLLQNVDNERFKPDVLLEKIKMFEHVIERLLNAPENSISIVKPEHITAFHEILKSGENESDNGPA